MNDELLLETDDVLVRRCQRGEEEAFRTLYERYRSRVASYAHRILLDRDLALDVVQETFTYLFRKFPEYAPEGKLGALVFKVARNLAINKAKRVRTRRDVPLDEGFGEAGEGEPDPGASIERLELRDAAYRALETLPEHYREVIDLKILQGLSYVEIGELVSCPEGTVKSRLHNGLELLRRRLGRGGSP